MMTLPRRTALRLVLAAGLLLGSPYALVVPTLAQDLAPGATGLIANAGGEPVLLRDAPDWNAATISSVGEGTALQIAEGPLYDANGSAWLGVVVDGVFGYIPAGYVAESASAEQPVENRSAPIAEPAQAEPLANSASPVATADVNFRAEPSNESAILWVIPAGTPLEPTGDWVDAFAGVVVDGQFGWVDGAFLGNGSAVAPVSQVAPDQAQDVQLLQEAAPQPAPVSEAGSEDLLATTLSDVNLRDAPDANAMVLGVLPAGSELAALAGPELGYWQVSDGVMTGWVDSEFVQITVDYLQRGKKNRDKDRGDGGNNAATSGDAPPGGIAWPVSGGTWSIMQGYNGSSHQNQDDLWQYYYSLDIVHEDGRTAGEPVYSPVNGTVTWTDRSSGGISIDIGGGHAVAMFHVDFDGRFEAGTEVSQGEPMGVISGSGGPGFAGSPHLHFTLWTSSDEGNWDRHAVPFTGPFAIEGIDLPDIGGGSQYAGTTFNP